MTMNNTPPLILVAACVLLDVEGKILIAKRPQGRPLAGLWEFPLVDSAPLIAATEKGTWVALRCDWPSGTECPGQILLRSRVTTRAPVRRKGRLVVRKKTAKLAIARRAFRLTGGGSHSFRVVLTGRGRELTRDREKLWAQLVVAIPGGRVTQAIRLR